MRFTVVAAALLAVVLLGLLFIPPQNGKKDEGNKTTEMNASQGLQPQNETPQNATEECKRVFTFCYTGETIMSRDCIDGKAVKWVCEPYYALHNKSTAGIPEQFMYVAEYKCYWEVRDKFGYAGNYHPAYVCQGPIVAGWKESCDCAGYIELVELSHPQRYYIKR